MFKNHKVIAVTPAGRARYLAALCAHVRAQPLIDEHHILMNPVDAKGKESESDKQYIESFKNDPYHTVINTADIPVGVAEPEQRRRWRIPRMFRTCVDPEAIYIFLSDDIVWMAPDAIETLLTYRCAHPENFLVFPNVVNTAMCSYLQQQANLIDSSHGIAYRSSRCALSTKSEEFAAHVHDSFITALKKDINAWKLDSCVLDNTNCREIMPLQVFCFFGKEFAYFDGIIPSDCLQTWLCSSYCHQWDMWNSFCGEARFVHFAHRAQEEKLQSDRLDILQEYERLAPAAEYS